MTKEDFKTAAAIRASGVSPLHHFGGKADDGGGGLIWVQLSEQVADIVCCASLLTRHKPKQPGKTKSEMYLLKLPILRRNPCQ